MRKIPWLWVILILSLVLTVWALLAEAKETPSPQEGRHFISPQDPEYKEYEIALKHRTKERIRKTFGVDLSSEAYSGFELLEIESFLRVRRPEESLDLLFKMFPRAP